MENSDHMKQIGAISGIDLIFENKSIMSEVDWKSKVGCFLSSRFKCFFYTSPRLQVDLGSLWYQEGSDWRTKVAPSATYSGSLDK